MFRRMCGMCSYFGLGIRKWFSERVIFERRSEGDEKTQRNSISWERKAFVIQFNRLKEDLYGQS